MSGQRGVVPLLVALLLGVLVTGCAGAGAARTAKPTRTATPTGNVTQTGATQQSNPVSVAISAHEQGVIADHNARLAIQVTIANNASKPIEILYPCGYDPIQFTVRDPSTSAYISGSDAYLCPPKPSSLYPPAIAVGATHAYSLADDLSHAALAPGQYTVSVSVSWQDAQATITPPAPNPTTYGSTTQQVTVTLR